MIIIGSLLSPFHYSLNHTPLASNLEAFIQLYVQLVHQSIVQTICPFLASILEASKHLVVHYVHQSIPRSIQYVRQSIICLKHNIIMI